jgi:hypothetical protein
MRITLYYNISSEIPKVLTIKFFFFETDYVLITIQSTFHVSVCLILLMVLSYWFQKGKLRYTFLFLILFCIP